MKGKPKGSPLAPGAAGGRGGQRHRKSVKCKTEGDKKDFPEIHASFQVDRDSGGGWPGSRRVCGPKVVPPGPILKAQ